MPPSRRVSWSRLCPRGQPDPSPHDATHLTFRLSALPRALAWRRALSVLQCLRFRGRPGPRRAGLRELSSRLWAPTPAWGGERPAVPPALPALSAAQAENGLQLITRVTPLQLLALPCFPTLSTLRNPFPAHSPPQSRANVLVVMPPLQLHQLPLLLLVAALQLRQPHPHLHLLRVQLLDGSLQRAHLAGGKWSGWGSPPAAHPWQSPAQVLGAHLGTGSDPVPSLWRWTPLHGGFCCPPGTSRAQSQHPRGWRRLRTGPGGEGKVGYSPAWSWGPRCTCGVGPGRGAGGRLAGG